MNISNPPVSIGLPVFNGEQFLQEALDSILSQTYQNFELIISNNASTDNTGEICQEYQEKDRRIRYYRNSHNFGYEANFRRVLELASSRYFMWTAADDIRPPNALETLLDVMLLDQRAVMVYGPILLKLEGQEELVKVTNKMNMDGLGPMGRICEFSRATMHNVMFYGLYRRDAALKAILGHHFGPDYLYNLQICCIGPIKYVSEPMLIYRQKRDVPTHDPMYCDLPVTMETLRQIVRPQGIRARKCRDVLFLGCYYLARSPGTPLRERLLAIVAHVWTFTWRFRVKLAKETVGMICTFIVRITEAIRTRLRKLLWFMMFQRNSRL